MPTESKTDDSVYRTLLLIHFELASCFGNRPVLSDTLDSFLDLLAKNSSLVGMRMENGKTLLHHALEFFPESRRVIDGMLRFSLGIDCLNAVYINPSLPAALVGTPLQIAYASRTYKSELRRWIRTMVLTDKLVTTYLDINVQHPVSGNSFVHDVAAAQDKEMLQILIKRHLANEILIDLWLKNSHGHTVLDILIKHGLKELAAELYSEKVVIEKIEEISSSAALALPLRIAASTEAGLFSPPMQQVSSSAEMPVTTPSGAFAKKG